MTHLTANTSVTISNSLRDALQINIKSQLSDFQVSEVPLPSLFKDGDIYLYRLDKTGLTTTDAIHLVAAYLSCPIEQVGYSGLKDEDGITSQLISLPRILNLEEIKAFHNQHPALNLLYQGTTDKNLQIGILLGNAFKITARNIPSSLADKLKNISSHSSLYVNYYGVQRFGKPGKKRNTHLIGKHLTHHQYEEAFRLLSEREKNYPISLSKPEEYFQKIDPRKLAFYLSSYHSYNWNISLQHHIKKFTNAYELCDQESISYSYIKSKGEKLKLISETNEQELIKYRVNKEKECYPLQSKRSILIPVDIYINNIQEDELNKEKMRADLSFFLPSGSYATVILPQFFYEIG